MGLIQELTDLFGKLKFFEIVNEYEQGLYFRNGSVIDIPIKRSKREQKELRAEEHKVLKDIGLIRFCIPFTKPVLPEGFRVGKIRRWPRHIKRFEKSKVLRTGFYLYIPFVDAIVKDGKQEKVLNLGNINVPTNEGESKVVLVSCNIRYELIDFYRAYTAVHDYEASLRDHTLSILAKHSRGKKYEEWKNTELIERLERDVLEELKKVVTEKWGLKIHRVYITDNVACNLQRVLHEGPPLIVKEQTMPEDSII